MLKDSASAGSGGALLMELTTDKAADQAEVVRGVREVIPAAFAGAQVRTRAA